MRCASGALPKLESLNLAVSSIGDVGITALATAVGSGALASCQKLDLSYNQISDAGLTALAGALSRKALASLKDLYCHEDAPALKAACQARGITFH